MSIVKAVTLSIAIIDKPYQELASIKKFLEDNPSDELKDRNDDELLEAIKGGRVFLIRNSDDGDILALGAIFHHNEGYTEVGMVRSAYGGYGFQRILHYARSVHEFYFEPPRKSYFASVRETNVVSNKNIAKCGFDLLEKSDPRWPEIRGRDFSGRNIHVLEEVKVYDHGKELRALFDTGKVTSAKKGKPDLDFHIDMVIFTNPRFFRNCDYIQ